MRLNYNMYSLSIYKNYKTSLSENSKAVANISSGKKLNSAKDNPSKITESENLQINLKSRQAAANNVQDTNSMLQTFDGALQEMNNNVSRLKDLTVKAASGTYSDEDCEIIQKEVDSILSSVNDLANNTAFNGIKLSQPNGTIKKSTIGALEDETVDIKLSDVTTSGLGLDTIKLGGVGKDADGANDAVDKAIVKITKIRSEYGAVQSRLDNTQSSIENINQPLNNAVSKIEDADIATESVETARTKILIQSAISLMAQSNQLTKDSLNILANVR